MRKYYYDCPVKAAYMASIFGLEYLPPINCSFRIDWLNVSSYSSRNGTWMLMGNLYINENSLSVFTPIPGDIIEHYNGIFYKVIDEPLFYMNELGGFISVEPTSASYYNRTDGRQGISINSIKRIVLRRGTEFIWPKEDV